MRDRPWIYSALLLFLILVTYPVWHGVAANTSNREPEVELPVGQKDCVAPLPYMRSAHMDLLIDWREGLVREHRRRYTAQDGKSYDVSLTQTCLGQCHGTRERFCDRCHSYAGVSTPYCWDCHTDTRRTLPTALSPERARRQHRPNPADVTLAARSTP